MEMLSAVVGLCCSVLVNCRLLRRVILLLRQVILSKIDMKSTVLYEKYCDKCATVMNQKLDRSFRHAFSNLTVGFEGFETLTVQTVAAG